MDANSSQKLAHALAFGSALKDLPRGANKTLKTLFSLRALDFSKKIPSLENEAIIEKFIAKNPNLRVKLSPNFAICVVLKTPARAFAKRINSQDEFLIKEENCEHLDIILGEILNKRGFRGKRFLRVLLNLAQSKKSLIAVLVKNAKKPQLLNLESLQKGTKIEIKHRISSRALNALPDLCVLEYERGKNTIVEVLGVLADPKIDEVIALKLFDKKAEFAQEVLEYAKSLCGTESAVIASRPSNAVIASDAQHRVAINNAEQRRHAKDGAESVIASEREARSVPRTINNAEQRRHAKDGTESVIASEREARSVPRTINNDELRRHAKDGAQSVIASRPQDGVAINNAEQRRHAKDGFDKWIATPLASPTARNDDSKANRASCVESPTSRHCEARAQASNEAISQVSNSEIAALRATRYARNDDSKAHSNATARNDGSRVDLTALPFICIDPIDARDHDDAIFYEPKNATLFVAIADVSYFVAPNSAIDNEAKNRAFSLYFPHFVVPMLPPILSAGICSFAQEKERLAFVWELSLDAKNGEILESKLYEAVVKVAQSCDYDAAKNALDSNNADKSIKKEVFSWLKKYAALTKKIRAARLKNGFDFESIESKITLNENGELKTATNYTQHLAHTIIEESMLLANRASAEFLSKILKNSGIYRVHAAPKDVAIAQIRGVFEKNGAVFKTAKKAKKANLHNEIKALQNAARAANLPKEFSDLLLIRAQQKASYAATPAPHFALGFLLYSHFTSPIRRYTDLFLHRLLKATLAGDFRALRHLSEQAQSVAATANLREREHARINQLFADLKFTRWAAKNLGAKISCVVLESSKFGVIATSIAPIFGARIFVDSSKNLAPLSKITGVLTSANLLTNTIVVKA